MTRRLKEQTTMVVRDKNRLAVVVFDEGTPVALVGEPADDRCDMLVGRRELLAKGAPMSILRP